MNNKKASILVVEDDVCLKTSMTRMIRGIDSDLKVDWATTLEEAKNYIAQNNYDLFLVDYMLPGLTNGMELHDQCKRNNPDSPFILISGLSVAEFLEIFKGHKTCPPFLRKPFSIREFQTLVRKYLHLENSHFRKGA